MKNITLSKNTDLDRQPSAHDIELLREFVSIVEMELVITDSQSYIPTVSCLIELAEQRTRELRYLLGLGTVDVSTDIQGGK